jgi:putative hydrolase of the HAD superfamily
MRILTAILFDLDHTLYHPSSGLMEAGDRRLTEYLASHQGLPWEAADALRERLWRQYGTTALGAERELGIPQADLYEYTQGGLQPEAFLAPDPAVAAMLASLDADLYVATNSLGSYAARVLAVLELASYFRAVLDIAAMGWQPKPQPEAYAALVAAVGRPADELAFIDDFAHNLPPARELGLFTVFLGEGQAEADLCLTGLTDLPESLSEAGVRVARGPAAPRSALRH